MSWPLVLPNDDGIRPAGPPDECFYCRQKVGTPHGPTCVCVTRRVKVRYTFEIEIDVPHHWDDDHVHFHRNESSWCATNGLDDVTNFVDRQQGANGCVCPWFKCEVVEEVDGTPRVREKSKPKEEGPNE
ncbi:MAG TPA: hypothetical protein VEA69_16760 [Tepidisphaeraceae bacterium]|nr:hypothetical protein [Tepidisphaeraceae bacterium]